MSFRYCFTAYSETTIAEFKSGRIECGKNNIVDVYWARYFVDKCGNGMAMAAIVTSTVKKLCDTQGIIKQTFYTSKNIKISVT